MIAFLRGRVAALGATFALLEVGGVGFKLLMSTRSLSALASDTMDVCVFTYLHVREDELTLFGFASEGEREAFEALLTVSGVGPKVALAVLSALTPEQLADAVATQDSPLISSVPGIGAKTAQRIIVDLAGRLTPASVSGGAAAAGSGSAAADAREALVGMGFSPAEVAAALKGVNGQDAAAVVRAALGKLGGSR